jgi:hypothetical protein
MAQPREACGTRHETFDPKRAPRSRSGATADPHDSDRCRRRAARQREDGVVKPGRDQPFRWPVI